MSLKRITFAIDFVRIGAHAVIRWGLADVGPQLDCTNVFATLDILVMVYIPCKMDVPVCFCHRYAYRKLCFAYRLENLILVF